MLRLKCNAARGPARAMHRRRNLTPLCDIQHPTSTQLWCRSRASLGHVWPVRAYGQVHGVIAGGNLWHHRVAILRLRGATPKIWRVTSTCLFKSMRHTSYLRMSTHVYACTTTGENGCLLRIFAILLYILTWNATAQRRYI